MRQINHHLKPWLAIIFVALALFITGIILSSCNVTKRTKSTIKIDSAHVVITDTVRVKKIDTTTVYSEVNEYHVKTIELFDTIRTTKDSVITYLKKRILYTDSFINRTSINYGITTDSSASKNSDSAHLQKKADGTEVNKKKIPWYFYLIAGGFIFFFWYTRDNKPKPKDNNGIN